MQLFFSPNINENTPQFTFPADESRHIVKVLRKKEGDTLHITNGKGFLFEATIISTANAFKKGQYTSPSDVYLIAPYDITVPLVAFIITGNIELLLPSFP